MKSEIEILKRRLIPIYESSSEQPLGSSPMVLPSLEQFISSDPTADFIFSNMTSLDDSINIGTVYFSACPSKFKYYYTETDYAEKLQTERLFVFGDGGDGSIFALNLIDRSIYHIDVSWGDNLDWREAVLQSWNCFDKFIDFVETEAKAEK